MVNIYKDTEALLTAVADLFVDAAREAIAARGQFNVALSGGSSPKQLYEKLASPAYNWKVDWSRAYFFFGDERYVPADDPESNALMVQHALFGPLNISPENIFAVNTTLAPQQAAQEYMQRILQHFKRQEIRFDLMLLGLGNDAHTASLFPGTTVLQEQAVDVKAVLLPDQKTYRLTLTAPLINLSHQIAFLVYGAAKAEAVRHVLEGERDTSRYPAQLIRPDQGKVDWFLDETAAALLPVKYKA
ncbi:6-phosphogluconolactonase [Pontibacter liquoris]|uniref:6-phosphogluconolactonase n=1 Tax=Pontibacter liquoris TaxID=2905677 RepID=UPI001FA6A9E4|nr:6-phosphogluconolactonase [Pontibacter liquoris]